MAVDWTAGPRLRLSPSATACLSDSHRGTATAYTLVHFGAHKVTKTYHTTVGYASGANPLASADARPSDRAAALRGKRAALQSHMPGFAAANARVCGTIPAAGAAGADRLTQW